MSAELGLAGANAARQAAALQESLASGHIATQSLSEYQERAKKILESDAPGREIAGEIAGPFLERGIHSNIERIGEALNRRYRKPIERAINQAGRSLNDGFNELNDGIQRMAETVTGRQNSFLRDRIPPGTQLDFDPQNVAGDLGSSARASAENVQRSAAARLNDFTEDGNYEGNGLKALQDAAKAAPRDIQSGETLPEEANTVVNLDRIGKGQTAHDPDVAKAQALRRARQAEGNARSVDFSMGRTPGGGFESYNLDEAQTQHIAGPPTEAPATAASRDFRPIEQGELPDEVSAVTRELLGPPEPIPAPAAPKPGEGSVPGSTPQDVISEQLASQRHLINGDTSNASELGAQADRPTAGATPSGETDAGETLGEEATREGTVTTADAAASESSKTSKAISALDDSADVVEAAAEGEGGANIFADAAALAIGLAGVIAPVLAPKPKLPPAPKPPPAIGTAMGVGV